MKCARMKNDCVETEAASGLLMSPEQIELICAENKQYVARPELNEVLYLHYRNFTQISNLEPYIGVKTLHLESNELTSVSGIKGCSQLRSLFLSRNKLCSVDADELPPTLKQLDLCHNNLTSVPSFKCTHLDTLLLANNNITSCDSLAALESVSNISTLDLQNNALDGDPEALLAVLRLLSNLRVLYLKGNPILKRMPHYRRLMIAHLPNLRYLDDRPIFDDEQKLAVAWHQKQNLSCTAHGQYVNDIVSWVGESAVAPAEAASMALDEDVEELSEGEQKQVSSSSSSSPMSSCSSRTSNSDISFSSSSGTDRFTSIHLSLFFEDCPSQVKHIEYQYAARAREDEVNPIKRLMLRRLLQSPRYNKQHLRGALVEEMQ